MLANNNLNIAQEIYHSAVLDGAECPLCIIREMFADEGYSDQDAAQIAENVRTAIERRRMLQ